MQAILSAIPHLLFMGAQAASGTMLMALSAPLLIGIFQGMSRGSIMTFADLFSAYPHVWAELFQPSFARLTTLLLIGLALGFAFAEVFYRLATITRYHREFDFNEGRQEPQHWKTDEYFKIMIHLTEKPAIYQAYEWENLQFSYIYYVEANCWFFVISILIAIIIAALFGAEADRWLAVASLLLATAVGLAFVMRRGREGKRKAFRDVYQVIRKDFVGKGC